MKELKKRMEELRELLNKMIKNSDSYCDNDELIKISHEMDRVINNYIKSDDSNNN